MTHKKYLFHAARTPKLYCCLHYTSIFQFGRERFTDEPLSNGERVKKPLKSDDFRGFCLLLPKKIQPGKPCGSMDSGFCATCVFVFLRFFQAISEPPYDILTKPCANRGEKRAVRQHSPLSYFSLMICSYSMAYLFSITILL